MKTLCLITSIIALLIGIESHGADFVNGEILSTSQGRLNAGVGDKIVTNVGRNYGVLKGDIQRVLNRQDAELSGTIGRCAVVKATDFSSICQIISVKSEIEPGDLIRLKKLEYADKTMYPLLFGVLEKVVESYEPHRHISVYIHDIYDDKENVTRFSQRVRAELKNLFSQKTRIRLANDGTGQAYGFYPSEYQTRLPQIKTYLNRDNIDVLISGRYQINGSTVEVSIYVIDKNWGDVRIVLPLPTGAYREELTEVVFPYTPIARKNDVACTFQYKPLRYVPQKDEKRAIVAGESDNNPFVEYSFGKIDFNIISPVGLKVQIDNKILDLEEKEEHQISLSGGDTHRLSVSFKKGYYYNESLMYTSIKEFKKDALLTIDKTGDLEVNISPTAVPGKEGIDLQVYKRVDKQRQILRAILRLDKETLVETFKD
jgi:hypothetical protein